MESSTRNWLIAAFQSSADTYKQSETLRTETHWLRPLPSPRKLSRAKP